MVYGTLLRQRELWKSYDSNTILCNTQVRYVCATYSSSTRRYDGRLRSSYHSSLSHHGFSVFDIIFISHVQYVLPGSEVRTTTNNKEVRVRRRTYLSVKSVCHSSNFTYVKRINQRSDKNIRSSTKM